MNPFRSLGISLLMLGVSGFAYAATEVAPGEKRAGWDFKNFALTPVLSGGRLKPMDSLARETILYLTGSRTFQGWNPEDMLLSILVFPKEWTARELIPVGRADVKRQLMLDEKRTKFSAGELFKNPTLLQYAQRMGGDVQAQLSKAPDPKANPRDEEMNRLLGRLTLFHNLISGDAWPLIPTTPPAAWETLAGDPGTKTEAGEAIRKKFMAVVAGYNTGDQAVFDRASQELRTGVEAQVTGWSSHQSGMIRAESFYNQSRPFLWAWILYLLAGLFWLGAIWLNSPLGKRLKQLALGTTIVALLIHTFGFALRCYVAGRPPVTNMYESIVWVSFGAVLFALLIYWSQRQAVLMATGTLLGAISLIVADSAPALMDPGIHPLVPVLRSNYWLTIHVLTITLGYAAFMLTMGLANVTLFQVLRGESASSSKTNHLNQLTYRAMQFGVVLLAAGTILGGIWADYSWGRFWGWDPKEVWALIALLTYLVILHGRFAGWVGQFGFAAWSVVAFTSVVMAWYGVNFVLGAGLHSYGFSAGGRGTVGLFVLLQLGFVALVAWVHARRKRKNVTRSPAL